MRARLPHNEPLLTSAAVDQFPVVNTTEAGVTVPSALSRHVSHGPVAEHMVDDVHGVPKASAPTVELAQYEAPAASDTVTSAMGAAPSTTLYAATTGPASLAVKLPVSGVVDPAASSATPGAGPAVRNTGAKDVQ